MVLVGMVGSIATDIAVSSVLGLVVGASLGWLGRHYYDQRIERRRGSG